MQFQLYAVIIALWANCSFAQTPKRAVPTIRIQEDGLILVMNSASITLRMNEAKEKLFSATFPTATTVVTADGKDTTATLTFGKGENVTTDLAVSKFEVVLKFSKEGGGYWGVSNSTATLTGTETGKPFTFNNVGLISEIGLYAPEPLSFHCSRFGGLYPSEILGNHSFSIDFNGFQVQPFANDTKSFAPAFECVGFFSIGILSGIFVTLILMAVLSWGLMMILDVKTMDRFDDPKGKPISFGGTE